MAKLNIPDGFDAKLMADPVKALSTLIPLYEEFNEQAKQELSGEKKPISKRDAEALELLRKNDDSHKMANAFAMGVNTALAGMLEENPQATAFDQVIGVLEDALTRVKNEREYVVWQKRQELESADTPVVSESEDGEEIPVSYRNAASALNLIDLAWRTALISMDEDEIAKKAKIKLSERGRDKTRVPARSNLVSLPSDGGKQKGRKPEISYWSWRIDGEDYGQVEPMVLIHRFVNDTPGQFSMQDWINAWKSAKNDADEDARIVTFKLGDKTIVGYRADKVSDK